MEQIRADIVFERAQTRWEVGALESHGDGVRHRRHLCDGDCRIDGIHHLTQPALNP